MLFASDYVLNNEAEEYECVSEDEFKEGMQLSESDDSDDATDTIDAAAPRQGSGVMNAIKRLLPPIPARKKKSKAGKSKKEHHWKLSLDAPCNAVPASTSGSSQKWFRKADTNVVSVNFGTLLSPGHMHAGDPVVCSSCQAILSHISCMEGDGEDKKWQCEFCGSEMHVDVEEEEIAKDEDVTYLLEPGDATKSTSLTGHDQALVIFCVDTSGSMCVTTEVEGRVKLRGTSQLQRLESFNLEGEDQFLPSQRNRDVSYISRLQAMQAAVDDQLETMAKDVPDRRIGLITFSNDVTVVGDGQQQEVTMAGDKLTKHEQLSKEALDLALPQAIRTSRRTLGEKVYRLEEGGATALGPALVVAVSMASHHPGSKVIVCTDGKANIGLGKLEDDADEQTASEFYTSVGESAVAKGVSISVITIKGTDCKLVHLGKLAEKTGGQVNIVDPLNLTKEFGNILADPIIATNVKAKFLVHKALYVIKDTESESQECHAEYAPGNVKSSTAITFEFGRRKSAAATAASSKSTNNAEEDGEQGGEGEPAEDLTRAKPEPSAPTEETYSTPTAEASSAVSSPTAATSSAISSPTAATSSPTTASATPSDYPFQLQISYTDTEGSKALRVITKTMPATSDRNLAEKSANMQVLGAHAAKKSADLALLGQYSKSRGVVFMNQRFAWRKSHSTESTKRERKSYRNVYSRLRNMENLLQQKQQSEIAERGNTRSDSEGSGDEDMAQLYDNIAQAPRAMALKASKPSMSKYKRMHQKRSSEMDDDLYEMAYNIRHTNPDEAGNPYDNHAEEND